MFACLESAREKERWEFEGNNRRFTSRDYDWQREELADILERTTIDILCVLEVGWNARSTGDGFKLFYYRNQN